MIAFMSEGSASEGTLPPLFFDTSDSDLRISSFVVWNVESDILYVLQIR